MIRFFLTLFFLGFTSFSSALAQELPGAFLGVYLADVNETRARDLKLPEARGAVVGKVLENTPAAKAGLRENDVILSFDNQPIQNAANVYLLLNETLPESRIMLRIMRNGIEQDLTVIMEARQGRSNNTQANADLYHRTRTWRLGIKVAPLTQQLADFLGTNQKSLLVTEVESRSLAERAGMKAGDCLLLIGEESIESPQELNRKFNEILTKSKGTVSVSIMRDRSVRELIIKTEENEK